MRQRLLFHLWLFPVLALSVAAPAQDAPVPSFDSPRDTMFTFLGAINAIELGQGDIEAHWRTALEALDRAGVDDAAARVAARRLNEVLDKLGEIRPDDLPGARQVSERGITRYVFFPEADRFTWVYSQLHALGQYPRGRIVLERDADGRWRFDRQTVGTIGELADSMSPLPPVFGDPVVEREPDTLSLLGQTVQETRLWEWGALGLCIFLGLAVGRMLSFALRRAGDRLIQRQWHIRGTVFNDLASPLSLAMLTIGLTVGLSFIQVGPKLREVFISRVVYFLCLLVVAWFLFNLINVIDVLLRRVTEKTSNKLDDMIVPLIRKTLRILLVIVFALVAAENVFGMDVTGFLAGLGIVGLAVSLAAQDSVKNLFGSVTIFFDKPFLIGDVITFDGDTGKVEEIGFRSTRLRLLNGHLVTVPNMKFTDSKVENITARPSIRRQMDITITYDTPPEKIEEAVRIVRDILHDPEVVEGGKFNLTDSPPRVAFNEFNADSLNIRAFYWYQLAGDPTRGFFTFMEHAQAVNLKLFRAFAAAGIDFAFPTQTLYLAGDPGRELVVKVDSDQRRP